MPRDRPERCSDERARAGTAAISPIRSPWSRLMLSIEAPSHSVKSGRQYQDRPGRRQVQRGRELLLRPGRTGRGRAKQPGTKQNERQPDAG